MRTETKRAYEKRIEALEEMLVKADHNADYEKQQAKMWKASYFNLKDARRHGETAREWAVEQAIRAGQPNIVHAASQIAVFVYGPDVTADSEAESPS